MSWLRDALSVLGVGALLLGPACAEPAVEPASDAPLGALQWSGCVLVDGDRDCRLMSASLRIWAPHEALRWTLDGEVRQPEAEPVDGGVRLTFDVTAFDSGPHVLEAWDADDPVFSLRLLRDPLVGTDYGFESKVSDALAERDVAASRRVADELLSEPSDDPLERLVRVHDARMLNYDPRDPGGAFEAMAPLLEREAALGAELGLWGVRCRASLIGLFFGTLLEDADQVRRWGALEGECRERSAGMAARFDHYLGTHAREEGAYAEAEVRLKRVRELVPRVHPRREFEADRELLDLLVRTGRWSEARRQIAALEAREMGPCDRAHMASQVGYARVRARQTEEADLGDPRPGLLQALDAHESGRCKNDGLLLHDRVKLGYDAAQQRDAAALREQLDALAIMRVDGKYRLQVAELELEAGLLEGRPIDTAAMAEGTERAEPEALWRYHMLRARASNERGDAAAAEAAYAEAEAVLEGLWSRVDSGVLRARWLASFRRSALGLMQLRLSRGDLEGAACVVRAARLRAFETPRARQHEDPCRRPWARAPGEVVFLVVPATEQAWHVLVVEDERVVSASGVAPPGPDAPDWWDRWDATLQRAQRVRILASGAALREPLHRAGWNGRPLIGRRPVSFGLDAAPRPERDTGTRASVVFSDSDPMRTLGRYRDRLNHADAVLRGAGWDSRWVPVLGDAAAMSRAIEPGGLLVYYGHGARVLGPETQAVPYEGDVGSTALLVGEDTYWGIDDVAALDEPPSKAVLLGCDVGFPDVRSWQGGLNLAHALLQAGTTEVLAGDGPLDAAMAAEVGAMLFEGQGAPRADLATALRRLWRDETDPPWRALRVWSR
ncbi:MAG: hypothetical protein AAGA54_28290 [Myxococcota bacterium]